MSNQLVPFNQVRALVRIGEDDEDDEDLPRFPRQPQRFIPRKSSNEKRKDHKHQQAKQRKDSKECQAMLAFGRSQQVMVDLGDKPSMERNLRKSRRQTKAEVRRKRGQEEDHESHQQRSSKTIAGFHRPRARSQSTTMPDEEISDEEADNVTQASPNDEPETLEEMAIVPYNDTSSMISACSNHEDTNDDQTRDIPSNTLTVRPEQ